MKMRLVIMPIVLLTACSTAKRDTAPASVAQPTSEIPERREFPVNEAISPCHNFYEYACSKVNSTFKLREDRSRHDFAFDDSRERLLEAKKKFLADLPTAEHLSQRSQILKTVYLACMNEEASKKEERLLVQKGLMDMGKIKSRDEFQKWLADRIVSPDRGLYSFDIDADLKNPDIYNAFLMPSLQSLPERSYYEKADVVHDFEDVLALFFKTIGKDRPELRAHRLVAFQKDFAQKYPLPAEFRTIFTTDNRITKKEFLNKFPNLQLSSFLKQIPNTILLRDLTPDAFSFVDRAVATGDLETLKDLYLFHELSGIMDDAYPEFFNKLFAFNNKHLGGPPVRPVRAERCTTMVMSRFRSELDSELLPKLFPQFPEQKFRALAGKVRKSIIAGIRRNTWLTAKAKAQALKKMEKVRLQLLKPRNDEEWDFNPPAKYSIETPYTNLRTLHENLVKRDLARLKKHRNKNIWDMGPLTVNAYYSPSDNKFVIPIGILQWPFYDPQLPEQVNLGAVGAVMGHELGHGIDDQGAKFDADGKLDQWMTDQDLATFKERGSKLVDQFNSIGHNGKLTLGENIGDLVGVTFAYQAAFPEGKGDPQLKRDFFLQYARVWCTVERPKLREMLLKVDPHSAGFARTNEQVKQQPAFSEAYQCKRGDPMTLPSDKRVEIW